VSEELPDINYTIQGNPKLEFVCLTEDEEGQIWAGTSEKGVFKFAEETPKVYSLDQGLKAKYTYAIGIDPKGYIWVGHRLGLSKIDPVSENIVVFDQEMGFTSDVLYRAIEKNARGQMLFGTNNGLILYDTYQARVDSIPPRLNISLLTISDSIYDSSSDIKLPFGVYKIRFDFVGINLTNPDQVTYRYKLDGFDDWSEPTRETFAKYSRIEDGNYTFMLQACDGNGNCTGETAMVSISVKIPIWKAWWFIISLILIAIISVFVIIKVRERNQKALQEYLEQQLEERTREVIHQKEEIEIKNRDITDSINYAQRIQASILPPIQRLHQTFGGSFVFYQPRDIVSGDFYWYDRLDHERFMIVCADSTGHGVPGAFMSMIGTTLIKDICLREDVKTPSDVLMTLDEEVREALNQNKETDGSNDGMDIIVAEINMKTMKFIVSSAMRPVILYRGGEQIYVKGSRSSIGGQLDDTSIDKNFVNEEFQLSKGDIIYMFSDGYPDQFGGPLGRKFKMVRLKNLLRDIHDKPMEEQYNYVKSNFFLWKEDLDQVDDVLFMGIKI
jgi:serine phosphatase RsbU (regulator of sigma subunit)